MQRRIQLETNRTQSGYARATLSRYFSSQFNRVRYAIKFYSDFHHFDHHKELQSYVLERYNVDIGERKDFWGI